MAKKAPPYIKRKPPVRPSYLPKLQTDKKQTGFEQGKLLLDRLSAADIDLYKETEARLQAYYLDEYYYYAAERAKRSVQITEALCKKTSKFEFENHYRCVLTQYNDRPLSSAGSRISAVGGRFNFGRINDFFPTFPALYIGENARVARLEMRQVDEQDPKQISFEDFKGVSISDYRVNGVLNNILDITVTDNLKPFLKVISRIEASPTLNDEAIRAGLNRTNPVSTMRELTNALLHPNWRLSITRFSIPSNSQSFGNLVKAAKIEAIRYQSKFRTGTCIAIFPENLGPGSYVSLSDKAASNVILTLNSDSYPNLI
ncbi:MAG: RES family NAD+ phosphorylase [Bdellovibrionales bacterium]|nr:RES family NAD+ phosphorylase [Bdellovibrionales bacterium]